MKLQKKIKNHWKKVKFTRITRKVAKNFKKISRGYIVDFSEGYIVIQESDDFRVLGFNILPITQLKKIRYNKFDEYYDRIMSREDKKSLIGLKTKLDLKEWKTIFKTLQKNDKFVIIECEDPKISSFTIGEIKRITNKSVSVLYFDAAGILDIKPTKVKYENISKVIYDDRYINVFKKYIRKQK